SRRNRSVSLQRPGAGALRLRQSRFTPVCRSRRDRQKVRRPARPRSTNRRRLHANEVSDDNPTGITSTHPTQPAIRPRQQPPAARTALGSRATLVCVFSARERTLAKPGNNQRQRLRDENAVRRRPAVFIVCSWFAPFV